VPALLVLFGVGTVLGSVIGGRVADRFPRANLLTGLAALAAVAVLLPVAARGGHAPTLVALFAFGVAAFAINPALQAQVMADAADAPTLASAVNISAFNVGNTLGPFLGGLVLAHGLGFGALALLGAALALAALLLTLLRATGLSLHPARVS
jgi:DHA1 family inner membrane transport protein